MSERRPPSNSPRRRGEDKDRPKSAFQKGGDMSGIFWAIVALAVVVWLVEQFISLL